MESNYVSTLTSSIIIKEANNQTFVAVGTTQTVDTLLDHHYRLVENVQNKEQLLRDLIGVREGDDLIIYHADGSQIIFTDYYRLCTQDSQQIDIELEQQMTETCSVTVAGNNTLEHVFTAHQKSAVAAAEGSSSIVYIQGEEGLLTEMLGLNTGLDSAIATFLEAASEPAAGLFLPGLIGGTGALGALALAGSGSGSVENNLVTPDVPDTPPSSAPEAPSLTLSDTADASMAENTTYAATAPTLTGTPIGDVKYTLTGADARLFAVDKNTGVVTMASPDYEDPQDTDRISSYHYTLVATDSDNNQAFDEVVLKVTNVDEVAPNFTSGTTADAIVENSGENQVVFTAAATDTVDFTNKTVTYALGSDVDTSVFAINENTGVVTLIENPDFETKPSYTFEVVATDATGNTSTQTVTLAVTNVDDVAPNFTSGTTADAIVENTGENQVVFTAKAADTVDFTNTTVTYALGSDVDSSVFAINSASGAVTLIENPNFETTPNYTFEVVATDATGNTSTQTVTLAVTNVNEPAVFLIAGVTGEVSQLENSAYSTASPKVFGAPNGVVKYSLEGLDAQLFSVNETTGVVTMEAQPNFEDPQDKGKDNTYHYTLVATDGDGNRNSSSLGLNDGIVTLTVTNVDEVAPNFTSGTTATADAILENSGAAKVVYTAKATDTVDSTDEKVTYSLVESKDHLLFEIDDTSGEVKLKANPNFETKPSYTFEVVATDATGNTSTQTVTLPVIESRISITDSIGNIGAVDGDDSVVTFLITREGNLSSAATVAYEVDALSTSAKWGANINALNKNTGTVSFAVGESLKEVSFTIENDGQKEINEQVTIKLSPPNAADEATFTINNDTAVGKINKFDTGPTSAFSLNDINQANNDSGANYAIQVRNSANQKTNIGFDDEGNLNIAALQEFVGEGNGYVTRWYDQSGHQKHMWNDRVGQQGVIMHQGQLITHGTSGKVAIAFNTGLNGEQITDERAITFGYKNAHFTDDKMFITSPLGSDFQASYIETIGGYSEPMAYKPFPYATALFNIGQSSSKNISVFVPEPNSNEIHWDTGSTNNKLSIGSEINAGDYQELVTVFNGAGDSPHKAIYMNGNPLAHETIDTTTVTTGSTWYFASQANFISDEERRPASILVDKFILTIKDKAPALVNEISGTELNNTFVYTGDSSPLVSINGEGGYDTVALFGDSHLNAEKVTLENVELVYMLNRKHNTFTINDAQIDTNTMALQVLMDETDQIKYHHSNTVTELTHQVGSSASAAHSEMVTFGTSGSDTIDMSGLNETVFGRGGQDEFVWHSWSNERGESVGSSIDTLQDFTQGNGLDADTLNLKGLLGTDFKIMDVEKYISIVLDSGNNNVTLKLDIDGASGFSAPELTIVLSDQSGINLANFQNENLILS